MNCHRPKHRSPGGWLARLSCCLSLALTLSGLAQTNNPPATRTNQPAPDRFLLIYDISSGMEKRAANAQQIIGQMFAFGLNGELKRGDQIGAWSFNHELHTGEFALLRWVPETSQTLAATLVAFVERQRYSKSPTLAPVMAQLTNVVADSDELTVILVSDGSAAPVGTMFDDQIAEAFKLNAAEQRRLAMPFVTILRAAKGKFVSLRVNTPPWPIELPAFPGDQKLAPPPTNPPPTKAAISTPAPTLVPVAPEPIRPTPTNLAVIPATNSPVVEAPPLPAPEPTNPPPAIAIPSTPPPSNPPVTELETTNPTPVSTATSPTTAPTAPPTAWKLPLIPIVAGAGVVLGIFVIFCFVLLKRSRAEPRVSLITRSMNKDRK